MSAFVSVTGLNTQIVLRTCRREDIASVVHYFETEAPEVFDAVGVDLRFLPTASEVGEDLESLCFGLERASSLAEFVQRGGVRVPLVFSVGDRLVGHLVFVREFDGCAGNEGNEAWFAHSHIWNEGDRARGIGSAVVPMMIAFIRAHLPISRLILEMNAENIPIIRVLEKEMRANSASARAFRRAADYDRPARGIARAMRVARFEIEI